ncbi:caspase domain-containing protein [Flammula alnicola]|nr:caspase domain-containing protein [Flammula alnicola]
MSSVTPTEQLHLFALIIGINTYESDEFRNLRGGVADAESFKQYLEVDLKVPRSQITFLIERGASRSAILSGFKNLQNDSRIQRGDPIFVFYAGYGGELKPPQGWDTGGRKIQVLVPHDYSTKRKIPGITDREVRKLLDEISKEKGDNITVVFNCCHAASGRRVDEDESPSLVRSVAAELDWSTYSDIFEGEERAAQFSPETAHIGLNSHVLVTACSLTEYAKESNGRGNFSTAFLTLLRTTGPDKLRYRDISKHLDLISNQNPQCEGVNQNRFIFNKMVLPHQRAPISVRSEQGNFILEAGTAQGINIGAEFTIYASKEDVARENLMGVLVVDAKYLESYSATMKVPPGAPNIFLPQPGVAVQTQAGHRPDLRLFIRPDPQQSLISLVRETRHDFPNVTIVEKEEDAQISIEMLNGKVTLRIVEQKLTRYNFARQIDGIDPTLEGLSPILKTAAHYYWQLNRTNDSPEVMNSIQVKFYKLREDEVSEDLIPVGDNLCVDNEIDFIVEEDQPYGVKLINTNKSRDFFPSLFCFDCSDLSIGSYYQHPLPGAANHIAEPPLPMNGGSLTIGYGAGGAAPFSYFLREGQDVDVGFMKVFLFSKPVDLSDVVQDTPFEEGRHQTTRKKTLKPTWGTVTIPVIQRRYPLTRQRSAVDPNTLAIVPRREGLPPSPNFGLPDLTGSVALDGSRSYPIGVGGYANVHLATLSASGGRRRSLSRLFVRTCIQKRIGGR